MFTVLRVLLSKCGACSWWCFLGKLQTDKDLMVHWHTAMIADYLCHCRCLNYVCDLTFWGKKQAFLFFRKVLPCLGNQSLLLSSEACHLELCNMSEMNGHKPITLPSIFLTPPCNHHLILTSQVTDRLLAALPVPFEFPLPLAHSSAGCIRWPARWLCCCETCFSGGCCRIIFGFSPGSRIQVRV